MGQITVIMIQHAQRGSYYAYEARYAGYYYAARTRHGC